MGVPLVPALLRSHLTELAANDDRHDGRSQWEGRKLELEVDCAYNADGSARVRMGDTIVYAGVKLNLMTPYPDRPNEGGLMTSCELRPIAGVHIEAGPPSPESIELGRVVDRGIRESGCINTSELCILPGEKAWQVIIDLHAISDDGNLFDAFGLAAIAALRTALVPAEKFDVGDNYRLPIKGTPIICSFHRVGGRYVYDANREEELGGDERIHITLGDEDHIHSLQKGLKGVFTRAEFDEILEVARARNAELRTLVSSKEED
jgi:exosome complex component RRP42